MCLTHLGINPTCRPVSGEEAMPRRGPALLLCWDLALSHVSVSRFRREA